MYCLLSASPHVLTSGAVSSSLISFRRRRGAADLSGDVSRDLLRYGAFPNVLTLGAVSSTLSSRFRGDAAPAETSPPCRFLCSCGLLLSWLALGEGAKARGAPIVDLTLAFLASVCWGYGIYFLLLWAERRRPR